MHRPNRVMRQFKLRQSIPVPALDNDELHNVTRIGHRNTDWKSYHKDVILLWNRNLRYVVRGERHGKSRQTDDDYLQWYEGITVRIISPTVHGVGFRPHPYDFFVARHHHTQQNFSTPSPDSYRSSFSQFGGFDTAGPSGPAGGFHTTFLSTGFDTAGPSRPSGVFHSSGPTSVFDTTGSSSGFDTTYVTSGFDVAGPSCGFDPTDLRPGSVGQGYHTPFFLNYQSFTDLLNDNRHQLVYDFHVRNVVSPIHFLGYSAEQNLGSQDGDVSMRSRENNPDNDELGRGRIVHRPADCGIGGYLHY